MHKVQRKSESLFMSTSDTLKNYYNETMEVINQIKKYGENLAEWKNSWEPIEEL